MVNILDKSLLEPKRLESVRESAIEAYLVRKVKELGGEVRKLKWIGRASAPDRCVMLPREAYVDDHHCCIWIEVKSPGGKVSFPKNAHERKQFREHERMRAMGQRVEVIDSYEGVDELLR